MDARALSVRATRTHFATPQPRHLKPRPAASYEESRGAHGPLDIGGGQFDDGEALRAPSAGGAGVRGAGSRRRTRRAEERGRAAPRPGDQRREHGTYEWLRPG